MLNTNSNTYDEQTFGAILEFERRRTDRSKVPFLLFILEFSEKSHIGQKKRKSVASQILSGAQKRFRQTDIMGWYRDDTAIGILFTEINDLGLAVPEIYKKIDSILMEALPPDQLDHISISIHPYPSQDIGNPETSHHQLYRDMKRSRVSQFVKKIMDFLLSGLLLIVLSPIFAAIGLAIKLNSKGPIIFRQTRVGQFGRPFVFLKFRSMYVEADHQPHQSYIKDFILYSDQEAENGDFLLRDGMYKLNNDDRITPVGRFIRKTSLDELPQLYNVLRGEMSLVGPRPPMLYEVEDYDVWHLRRTLQAKPGITGLWQLRGRSRTTFEGMVRLDLKYIDKWSIWSDIKILLQTPWVVLRCTGAR